LPNQLNRHQGWLYRDNNAHTKAQSAYEEALEIYRTLAKTNPDAYLSEVAMTLFQGFFVSVLCFCMCVVAIVKTAKIVERHCHLR
jgi:tetratricopeptide (TPR) repeat protein